MVFTFLKDYKKTKPNNNNNPPPEENKKPPKICNRGGLWFVKPKTFTLWPFTESLVKI